MRPYDGARSSERLVIYAMAQNKFVPEITDHVIAVLCYDCFDQTSNTALMADED